MNADRLTRFEALLDAHAIQQDAAWVRARKVERDEQATAADERRTRYTVHVNDRAAHRCPLCGGWLYSFRPCKTPGCADA